MHPHRLKHATSPYLQQHADNPVDWWPWCEEALQLAREQDKPILLSIGYSACHWCHVMAHESFEDPATAAVMNELFVNIKVDREERPDLDRIYQTAYQLLARRAGGWPLTVFLMPDDHSPFFAGTYFPPQPRHGLPAFVDVLRQIAQAYRERRPDIEQQNASVRAALVRVDQPPPADTASSRPVDDALAQLAEQFDTAHGGFGGAPKFPHPGTLRFLLREGTRRRADDVRHMALHTLERMAAGGVNDHLGGGFCRYSVDDRWVIPHFEKMLYDNGQLLGLYAEAWVADDRRPVFKHVCERTAEWIMREMQADSGGYFASLDADSEGEEGRFYVWQADEVRQLLDADEFAVFAPRFGLDRTANFEGRWHLHTFRDTEQIAQTAGIAAGDVRRRLSSARHKLFAARELRVRPGRDEKILTSWNALTIKGMAKAGRLLQVPEWIDSAARAMAFLRRFHWRDGRLLASSRDGHAHLAAYLDDHAYLVDAALELLQARWDSDLLDFA
ncbi:MAG: thioredoxin domain-containing protein, partial [Gammaproteobacteria bacterium]|nr:thioredoxin domain-containing protein [Gammaproteobacteria bacterium]